MVRPLSPSSQQEESMRINARQQMAQEQDPKQKLRLMCLARGSSGVMALGRVFRRMDNDGSKTLSLEELKQGLGESEMELSDDEVQKLFTALDTDGTGTLDYEEFLSALRPELKGNRVKLVEMAFDKLDSTDDGIVTLADLKGVYSVDRHPMYLSGELTEDQILAIFLRKFENKTSMDGKITKIEFLEYYAGVSASIDDDAYFDLMMRNAWGLK
uniref:Calcyphosin-like protein n=1 Tax=Hirondellea gigas TaxID=1518452 RepID=A0A6A7G827_9CRUS